MSIFETNVEHCVKGPGLGAMDSETTIETMTHDVALMLQFLRPVFSHDIFHFHSLG